jgi:hypothetical protein
MGNMNKDHYYAEVLNLMRAQGSKDNPTTLQLGVMQSATSVKINDLVLNSEDIYVADNLTLYRGDIVAVQKLQDTNMYVILARVVQV